MSVKSYLALLQTQDDDDERADERAMLQKIDYDEDLTKFKIFIKPSTG